ncbi:MAG: hypothetical protein WCG50_05125 [Rhodoferax sp.]|uniref:hypothetical protein n=1 Tax=Rhodoferax sp. TaxID=50421 RepID=UPI00301A365C
MVGLLAKKQLGALSTLGPAQAASAGVSVPTGSPQQQSQQLQNQVKKTVEDALQQARPESEEK